MPGVNNALCRLWPLISLANCLFMTLTREWPLERPCHIAGSKRIRGPLISPSGFSFCGLMEIEKGPTSVFQHQLSNPSQLPPQRRITLDEAPSMMPAQATHAQQLPAQFTQQQHLQGQTQGSAASFASLSGGHAGHTRKKARIG